MQWRTEDCGWFRPKRSGLCNLQRYCQWEWVRIKRIISSFSYLCTYCRWKVLEIAAGYSSQGFVDRDMMSAAGMLEGYLTQKYVNCFSSAYLHLTRMYMYLLQRHFQYVHILEQWIIQWTQPWVHKESEGILWGSGINFKWKGKLYS